MVVTQVVEHQTAGREVLSSILAARWAFSSSQQLSILNQHLTEVQQYWLSTWQQKLEAKLRSLRQASLKRAE